MLLLAFGVVAFAAIHLVSAIPPLKARIAGRLGGAYGASFGLASILALAAIVIGWRMSSHVAVYSPLDGSRYIAFLLVLLGFVSLGIFLFRGQLRQVLRLPLAIGTILWAAGHLLVNGDAASLILFGGLGAYGVAHYALGMAYGVRPSGDVRHGHDMLAILAGIALFGLMTQLHAALFGVPIVELSQARGAGSPRTTTVLTTGSTSSPGMPTRLACSPIDSGSLAS